MPTIICMPKWGSAMTHGKIVSWSKEEGEGIESGEALVEIETEKISNLVEAPVSGIVRKILVPEGEAAPVSAPIAVITAVDEQWDGKLDAPGESGQTSDAIGFRRERASGSGENRESASGIPDKKAVTPAARSLAKKRGIDLNQISGSGAGGRIVLEDVFEYLARLPTLVLWGAEDRITPLKQGIKAGELPVNGSFIVFEGCGHCPHIELAGRFNEEVAHFVRKLLS